MVTTTSGNTNNNNGNNDASAATQNLRPTEAQLRWAQFHFKRRSQGLREKVELMYQTPLNIEDVEGAMPEDGNATTSASSEVDVRICNKIKARRPKVSKGRRALLRASRRTFIKRKQQIEAHGYQGGGGNRTDEEEQAEEDALNEIFMMKKRRRRNRRGRGGPSSHTGGGSNKNDESYKRFQAACHAMMMSIAASATPTYDIEVPTKKWTRTADHIAAASLYDEYLDPKWGIRRRPQDESGGADAIHTNKNGAAYNNMPLDRAASWLIHLPKVPGGTRENPYYNNLLHHAPIGEGIAAGDLNDESRSETSTSTLAMRAPGQKKFNDLLALVQQRMIQRAAEDRGLELGPAPKMYSRPQFVDQQASIANHQQGKGDFPEQTLSSPVQADRGHPEFFLASFRIDGVEVTSGGIVQQHSKKKKIGRERKTNYVPRMRLRDFLADGVGDSATAELQQGPSGSSPNATSGIPKMKLREFEAMNNKKQEPRRLSKAMEIAKSLEPEPTNTDSKTKQMIKSLEGDKTPKMRLRNFDFGQGEGHDDEKKISEDSMQTPRRKPHRFSDRFLQQEGGNNVLVSPADSHCCSRCSRPSPKAGSITSQSDFIPSTAVGGRGSADSNSRMSASSGVSGFFAHVRNLNANDAINAGSRASEFFSKLRQQQPQDSESDQGPIEEQHQPSSTSSQAGNISRNSDFFAQVRQINSVDQAEKQSLCQHCLEDDFVTAASANNELGQADNENISGPNQVNVMEAGTSKSAVTGILNRGRSSFITIASKLNSSISGSPMNNAPLSPRTAASTSSGNMKKAAANVSGIVGGFFQTMRASNARNSQDHNDSFRNNSCVQGHTPNEEMRRMDDGNDAVALAGFNQHLCSKSGLIAEDGEIEEKRNSENDLVALAGYRQNRQVKRESMSQQDDTSSLSSYQALPENIREMVKSKMGSPSRQHEEFFATTDDMERPSTGSDSSSAKFSTSSSARSSAVSRTIEDVSPEKLRYLHGNLVQSYVEPEKSIIDTDETSSDFSGSGGMHPEMLASLMLSPDLLTKRHHQAIRAIEMRSWEQVGYLINANPWLVEMCELTTNQYLLHKIAFFGGGDPCAPEDLCMQMIEKFPAAMHKFDRDGNVPLHLAAAAGHMKMIKTLGALFESGASVRNEDGMLPLHFAIASYGATAEARGEDDDNDDSPSPMRVIKTVLKLFPQGIVITDSDGNLPIHVAVECLESGMGTDIVYLLLDEADRQLQDPVGARFRHKAKLEEIVADDMSDATMSTEYETDSVNADGDIYCNAVKNDFDETPLLSAIRNKKGWGMIEALVSGPGGRGAALLEDAEKNNALHLLVGDYQDPAAAMSILKTVPETASKRNAQGMLPIEVACMEFMPDEVILAIALADLPFDIEDKEAIKISQTSGGSWWFLACECDDHHFEMVANVLSICTFQQRRALSLMEGRSNEHKGTVISSATPKCRQLLSQGQRFIGRFEFLGESALYSDPSIGLKEFEAYDYGDVSGGANVDDGRKVTLKRYSKKDPFLSEITSLHAFEIDSLYTEEVSTFGIGDGLQSQDSGQEYCISIEYPQLSLDRVVDGMVQKGRYLHDVTLQKKYAAKISYVLRSIAKALKHVHDAGAVHGNVCLENCGRFEQSWKLRGRLGLTRIGETFDISRFHQAFPPEFLTVNDQEGEVCDSDEAPVSFRSGIVASPAIDIWAFGKLAYEAIVGQPMIGFDSSKRRDEDVVSLLEILEWDQSNMKTVFENLLDSGVPESGADLITSCLFANPGERPSSMYQILDNPFWKEMRRFREQTKRARRQDDATSSVFTGVPGSIYTEGMSEI